ncbi:MAG: protein kinase [Chloroflexi bacterium]|nr:protein kinase [Chloroflexota bacterium]
MSDLTGRTLGKYELVERLGRGGMADVYKAIQRGMERFVAVKVMHGHLAESEDFIVRFRREAQSVGNLRHPHIVQVIDFDVEGDVYYMVMEYIKGGTLKTYIQQKGALPVDEALRVTGHLSDALAYAHQNGMIHRDIKPANVMFTDNSYTHPVLTDFGIARILGQSGITMSGAFIGTPAYMSPEAGRGTKVDDRSDIYSMGIMLYEMVTGTVPYDADTPFAIVMKHINDPLPSPRRFNANLPNAVELVVLKALSKDPEDRYPTAGELGKAVQQAREDLKSEAPTADSRKLSTAVGGKPLTEMATFVPDSASGKELPTVGPRNMSALPDTFAKDKTQPPIAPTKRKIPYPLLGGGVAVLALVAIVAVLLMGSGNDNKSDGKRDVTSPPPTDAIEAGLDQTPLPTTELTEVVTEVATTDAVEAGLDQTPLPTAEPTQAATELATEVVTEAGPQPTVFAGVIPTEPPVQQTAPFNPTIVVSQPTPNLDTSSGGGSATEAVMAPPTNADPSEGRYTRFVPDDDPAIIDLANAIDELDYNQGVDAAFALTETALKTYPGNPILMALHSGFLLRLDQPKESLAEAEEIISNFPEHPMGYLALANYYYTSEEYDYDRAFQAVETAYNLAPDNRTTVFDYAFALTGQYRFDEAIAMFNHAEELGAPLIEVLIRRADVYWQIGDYAAAAVDDARLLELREQADTRLVLAGAYLLTDRPDDALRTIEAGFEFYDTDAGYYANAAFVAHSVGNGELAENWANTALTLDDSATTARYVLGLVAFSRGDFEDAETRFQEVADAENQNYQYPYLNPTYDRYLAIDQARTAHALGKTDAAIAFYQTVIDEVCCWWATPYLERASLYVEQSNWDAAAADFRDVYNMTLDLYSHDEVVTALLAQPVEVIQAVIRDWIIWDNNYDLAHDFAMQADAVYPGDPVLLFEMADVHILREEYDQALTEGQNLIETAPDNPLGYLVLAYYYRQTEVDSDEQMLAYAQQAIDRAPDDPFVTLEYARILYDADLGDAVIEAYNHAEEVDADRAKILDERASYAAQMGNYSEAINDLLALMEIETNNPYLVTRLAGLYLRNNDLQAALDLAVQHQEIEDMGDETASGYYSDLAFLAWLAKNGDLAQSFLDRVIADYQNEPKVVMMKGLLAQLAGDYEASNTLLESLADTESWRYDSPYFNPDFDHSLDLEIARNYVALKDPDAAIEAYRRAIDRGYYRWLTPHLELADVLAAKGDIEGARSELIATLDLTEDDATREAIQQKIVDLGVAPSN